MRIAHMKCAARAIIINGKGGEETKQTHLRKLMPELLMI